MDQVTQGGIVGSILGTVFGFISTSFLGKKVLEDRDNRLKALQDWKDDHVKNHPNLSEAIRMHNENREWMAGISDSLEDHKKRHEEDFRALMTLIIGEKSGPGKKSN